MRARWLLVSGLGGALAVWLATDAHVPSPRVITTEKTVVIHQQNRDMPAPRREVSVPVERAAAPAVPPAFEDEPPPPGTADQEAAADDASRVVDEAIASGHWTNTDNARMAAALPRMHPEAREAMILGWASAVNDQRIALDVPPAF